jgi:SAM-dependent methyltransferase
MKKDLLKFMVCPEDGLPLTLTGNDASNDEIMEGTLVCRNSHTYEISGGVPRMLVSAEANADAARTQESFSAKWRMTPSFAVDGPARAFYLDWYLQRYGFGHLDNLRSFLSTKRMILEAGAGVGRDALLYGENTTGQVFALDISAGIDFTYRNAGHLPNVHVIQADLRRVPFPEGIFDYVVSDQVLHHTPNTETSFKYLSRYVAPEGHIAAYVYKKKGPIREFCDDFLRSRYAGGSEEECYEFSRAMTLLGKALSDLNVDFEVTEDIPILEIKAGQYNLQRFIYYHVFKCYWNDAVDLDGNIITNFDWYHPIHAWRHTPEEVKKWCTETGLEVEQFDVIESGISVRAKKSKSQKIRGV